MSDTVPSSVPALLRGAGGCGAAHRECYLVPKLLGPLQLPLHRVQLLAQLLPAVLRLPPVMLQDVQEDAL